MALPLAVMLAGTGAQMWGQDERTAAQEAALAKLQYATQINAAGGEAGQRESNAAYEALGEQYFQSGEQAANDLSAANMRGAFDTGSSQLQDRINGVLGSTPQAGGDAMQAAGQNTAFMNAQARAKQRNDISTDAMTQVLKNNQGLAGMDDKFRTGMADKGDRDSQIRKRIQDVMRLQNYADGVRSAALQRAGAEHGLDQARAASVGSGAMYIGALMQTGGSAMGMMGQQGQQALPPGQGPNPVPVGQDPYPQWYNQNDPTGMNPYGEF